MTTTSSDDSLLARLLRGSRTLLLAASLRVTPVPKPSVRVFRNQAYYSGKRYNEFKKTIPDVIADIAAEAKHHGPVWLVVDYVLPKPRTSKRAYPQGDVDNYCKAFFDAITKHSAWWDDDDQVIRVLAQKRWAEPGDEGGIDVEMYAMEDE